MKDVVSPLSEFTARLAVLGFQGEVATDIATRVVAATDNSVYEVAPLAVVYPRVPDDLNLIARAATDCQIAITARGGGTGTNGQSLSDAIIVDCSRDLTVIEEINVDEAYAIVQPGVILDQLNAAAAQHGLFFAPSVSTASRATVGGMAATDASGKGSRVYGRTSDHVLAMDAVLADGRDLPDAIGAGIRTILADQGDEIARVFPVMNRGLTGYNLQAAARDDDRSLIKLLCGSEGTLALTKRLKLRLLPRPKMKALVVYAYDDMDAALRDVRRLVTAEPAAIEFIDDNILRLAQDDPIWGAIAAVLAQEGTRPVRGLNFVEIIGDDAAQIDAQIARLTGLPDSPAAIINMRPVTDPATIAQLWQLRSKSVGLLSRMDPTRQGTPFVEDAAVPAQNLADFVAGFRKILDAEGLKYGMFGHADVGCVHVRPALDMRRAEDEAMIRKVSDAVHLLAQRHGGLIWGEHGKGFRGEYVPDVFGPQLYAAMCQIKALFDPDNLMNPGKIAHPDPAAPLTPIDAVPFRGALDAGISAELSDTYGAAVKCNGNGQCMGRDVTEAMCPSFKASGDRRRSPKGRAVMLRIWARMQSLAVPPADLAPLEAQLFDSLSDCLGCKACASQCPAKVDIPKMRSAFYDSYYATRRRPLLHFLLSLLEPLGPLLRAAPRINNFALRVCAPLLRKAGLVDLPRINPPKRPASAQGTGARVMLIADSFLGTFDGQVLDAAADVLVQLGYDVQVSQPLVTGKPLHVIGARAQFERAAQHSLAQLQRYAETGGTLVAIEPAFLAMFTAEYALPDVVVPQVTALDQFLLGAVADAKPAADGRAYTLLLHCAESASDPQTSARWQAVFEANGLSLKYAKTGCCGMAGTFGHEADKVAISAHLYDMSWRDIVTKTRDEIAGTDVLVTGFSCRCQVARFTGQRPMHPIEALRDALCNGRFLDA